MAGVIPIARDTSGLDAPPKPGKTKGRWRRALAAGAGVLALAAAGQLATEYWTVGRFQVSTDDAYVQADNTTIAPKVSGYLSAVLVDDNQPVRAGQVLARIDDRDFKVALAQAKADVAAADARIADRRAALDAQHTLIDSARATVAVDQAQETFAEQDNRRYAALATEGWGTVQKAQDASARIAAAHAVVTRDVATLANVTKQIDILTAQLAAAEADLAHARAVQAQAELNLSYTTIVSPTDGVVGNRTLRVGQYVQAGTQLMAVVPAASPYIVANYKETQLTRVHAGQPVSISVDTFPGQVFQGRVDSVAPASGQEFALLPPDNATGNFTKVVQRIPVKITLDRNSSLAVVLRPGMSVYPSIDTRPEAAAATPSSHG
ncbi:MAG TPA: HlyD family secretion protein [Acetobacteraceae bacterium]|nr:HlyD family secretion protein [Acetobacteraceae bacterium]